MLLIRVWVVIFNLEVGENGIVEGVSELRAKG
jgi:hypothetical protein